MEMLPVPGEETKSEMLSMTVIRKYIIIDLQVSVYYLIGCGRLCFLIKMLILYLLC